MNTFSLCSVWLSSFLCVVTLGLGLLMLYSKDEDVCSRKCSASLLRRIMPQCSFHSRRRRDTSEPKTDRERKAWGWAMRKLEILTQGKEGSNTETLWESGVSGTSVLTLAKQRTDPPRLNGRWGARPDASGSG